MLLRRDLVEFDDSLFQIGFSGRSKEFINFKPGHKITTARSTYVSKEVDNDPAFMILMGIDL